MSDTLNDLMYRYYSKLAGTSSDASAAGGPGYLYNGATFDRERTPNVFKTATVAGGGNTAVWTPTTGKKFRLMRYSIQVPAHVATSGGSAIAAIFNDGASTAIGVGASFYAPATSVTASPGATNFNFDLGNGYLSVAVNNVLNINLSAALSAGTVRVTVAGTEE